MKQFLSALSRALLYAFVLATVSDAFFTTQTQPTHEASDFAKATTDRPAGMQHPVEMAQPSPKATADTAAEKRPVFLQQDEIAEIMAAESGSYAYFGPFVSSIVNDLPDIRKNLTSKLLVENLDTVCKRITDGKTTAPIKTLTYALEEAGEALKPEHTALGEADVARIAEAVENYCARFERGDFDLVMQETFSATAAPFDSAQDERVGVRRVNDRTSETFRNIDVVRNASTRYLAVARNTVIAGNLTVGGNTTIDKNVTVLGNQTIAGNLNVTGTITGSNSGSSTVTGALKLIGTPQQACIIFYDQSLNEKARICSSATAGTQGIAVSVDGGVTQNVAVNNAGGLAVAAPSSGPAVTITGNGTSPATVIAGNGATPLQLTGLPAAGASDKFLTIDTSGNVTESSGSFSNVLFNGGQPGAVTVGTTDATPLNLVTDNTQRVIVSAAGNVTVNAPASGAGLIVNAAENINGSLNMLLQSPINLQDGTGTGKFVGLQAPATVPTSYTLSLPTTVPTAHQVMRANATTPTNLEWVTEGGSQPPAISKTIYVATYGNDLTGDGSESTPYASLSKAVSVANTISSASNPITIWVGSGIYTENNSTGPITITAAGISLMGNATTSVMIQPTTLSQNLLASTVSTRITNMTFRAVGSSTAAGLVFSGTGDTSTLSSVWVLNFATGASFSGTNCSYGLSDTNFVGNGTAIINNNVTVGVATSIIQGSATTTPANIGVSTTGSSAQVLLEASLCQNCTIGIQALSNSNFISRATGFRNNNNGIVQTGSSNSLITGCNFTVNVTGGIPVNCSGAGTNTELVACSFNGWDATNTPRGTAVQITGGATASIVGGRIENYITALQVGNPGDSASTNVSASSLCIVNSTTNDILQQGSASLSFNSSIAASSKISIADSTNVTLSYFDRSNNFTLQIGKFTDQNTKMLQAGIGAADDPQIDYQSSLYGSQGIGYNNTAANPATWFSTSANNSQLASITSSRTNTAGVLLVSDMGPSIGTTTALRGWNITKIGAPTGSSGALAFQYQNSDTGDGQPTIAPYTLMQLDGVNNQLQLPNTSTKIILGGDTNLYRGGTNILQTDSNFAITNLTPNTALTANGSKEVASSVTTSTELGYVSGVTGPIQTQLNSKLTKTGDTATGQILFTNGTTSSPSPAVGAANIGLSSAGTDLALSTNGLSRIDITSGGAVVINAPTAGTGLTVTANSSAPAVALVGQGTATTTALQLTGLPAGSGSDSFLTIDGSGHVTKSSGTFGNAVINGGQTGPVTVGTTDNTSLSFITGASGPNTRMSIDQNGGVTIATPAGGEVGLTISGGGATVTGATNINANTGTGVTNIATGTNAGALSLGRSGGTTNINGTINLPFTEGALITSSAGVTSSITGTAGYVLTANSAGTAPSFQINPGAGGAVTFNTDSGTATTSSNAITIHGGSNIATSGTGSTVTVALVNNPSVAELTVTTNGAAITGTTSINSSGTATTTIGNSTGPSVNTIAGTTNINTGSSSAATNIGNAASTTTIVGPTTLNNTGTATTTIGNATSSTTIAGATTITGTTNINTTGSAATNIGTSSSNNSINGTTTLLGITNINSSGSATTNIGTGSGNVNIGNSTGSNTITGATTFINNALFPAGTAALPAVAVGANNIGLSSTASNIALSTNGKAVLAISSAGTVSINDNADGFNTAGVVHNDSSGNLSSSLIVSSDIATGGVANSNLQTLTAAGLVANSATTATSTNVANAIVSRDNTGTFAGSLTGAASLNVLKAGDTMTGPLNMALQNAIRLQDNTGTGAFAGLNAPATVTSSYTVSLPPTAPTASQVLSATSPTQLAWVTQGGNTPPASSLTIYVTKFGNDLTGDGSFSHPYATIAKAVDVANNLPSSLTSPVTILVSSGTYTEDNSNTGLFSGPITITAPGISIVGDSQTGVIIVPGTKSNDLFNATVGTTFNNFTINAISGSTATGINLSGTNNGSTITNLQVTNFQTGIFFGGNITVNVAYTILNSTFVGNTLGLSVNNTIAVCYDCSVVGNPAGTANTGILLTGSLAQISFNSGIVVFCQTGVSIGNNASVRLLGTDFTYNINSIVQSNASQLFMQAVTFHPRDIPPAFPTLTDVQISGAGTEANLSDCIFSAIGASGSTSNALKVTGSAEVIITGGQIDTYTNAITVGADSSDTSATELSASSVYIVDCTQDITQNGSSTLAFIGGSTTGSKISINDGTNVTLAEFDQQDNFALNIGKHEDADTTLIHAEIGSATDPELSYKALTPGFYGTQAMGFENPLNNPASLYAISHGNASNVTSVTTDNTQTASLNLISDTASPIGGTTQLRGWTVQKTGTNALLATSFQNSDMTGGKPTVAAYTIQQLDGFNNQVQYPNTSTKMVFGGDTNFYRSGAGVLKTDTNLIVGGLTANKAVATDSNSQLVSSTTSATELGFLTGVTSSVQTQLNNKVSKTGDTTTGQIIFTNGTALAPSPAVGAANIGLSSSSGNLSLSTNGLARLNISSGGTVSITNDNADGFNTPGIVHNDASGNLSSSLIVNADVSPTAAIVDTKLATITTAGKVANSATTATSTNTASTIVSRDNTGTAALNITGNASGNLLLSGGTLTGPLTMPAGSAASPSLNFTGATASGLYSPGLGRVSLTAGGTAALAATATGITIPSLAGTAGVVHNDATGLLSSSLIETADIADFVVTNSQLATASVADMPGYIVIRDATTDYINVGQVNISGPVVNATDATTKQYVDNAVATGIVIHPPALVVSTTNNPTSSPPSGAATIDSVVVADGNRVLLQAQTNPIDNGLWLANTTGAWTRPADFFDNGTNTAGRAYVLIQEGTIYSGSSWLCSTPDAIIGTDPIFFQEFTAPSQTTGNNVGTGAGTAQVYRDTTGTVLNFRSLNSGTHVTTTNVGDNVTIATDATNANTASTIVARGSSGEFSAGAVTATGLTATTNGLNVTAGGATIAGNANLKLQSELRLQDNTGTGAYVGLNAPATVTGSYTVNLPAAAPIANQVLTATSPTQLSWFTQGGSVLPNTSRVIYVTTFGSDITGDGSYSNPFASLSKAVQTAQTLPTPPTLTTPVTILIATGSYTENNSAGPITITMPGISIIGDSVSGVIIMPSTASQDLLAANITTLIQNITFDVGAGSIASALNFSGTNNSTVLYNLRVNNFQTGLTCGGTVTGNFTYNISYCQFVGNTTGIAINDTIALFNNCQVAGSLTVPTGTGISITGSSAQGIFANGLVAFCQTGFNILNNSRFEISGTTASVNSNSVIVSGGATLTLQACSFQPQDTALTVTDVQLSGTGTKAKISDGIFDASNVTIFNAVALQVTNGAQVVVSSAQMNKYTQAIIVGTNSDTASTNLQVADTFIANGTNDITQLGFSTLNFVTSSASSAKISIAHPDNVTLAYFDTANNNSLTVGSNTNKNTILINTATGASPAPQINYQTSLYSTNAIGYQNPTGTASTLFNISSNNSANLTGVTTNNAQTASLNLYSDTDTIIGTTTKLRGWNLTKTATAALLATAFQNTDTTDGKPVVPAYTIQQLDGFNNQVQYPNTATKIVFGGDTDLYREAAGVLATDTNLIVGGLTPNTAIATNGSSQLVSSATTATELGFVHGVTSSIQPQINGKVSKSGDTMTGTLLVPAGSEAAPGLAVGAANIGLSSVSSGLSLSTGGVAHLRISSAGTVSIIDNADGFNTAGVVHNDSSGNLSSSLVVGNDIANLTIPDSKLQQITTANKVADSANVSLTNATSSNTPNTLVKRDGTGTFAGTLTGAASLNVLKAGDTMTGPLNMALQNAIRLQDNTGTGAYVGLNAPAAITGGVGGSYTISFPITAPTTGQVLTASSASQLIWDTQGGSVTPATSRTIYVTKYGNDLTGDGSFSHPYATIKQAVTTANSISTLLNPVAISVTTGTYTENNSAGPITITAPGVSLVGDSETGVIIMPSSVSHDLISTSTGVTFNNFTIDAGAGSGSTAAGISLSGNNNGSIMNTLHVFNFQTGIFCAGSISANIAYMINGCEFIGNGTAVAVNNTIALFNDCNLAGSLTAPANTGISITGSLGQAIFADGLIAFCQTGFNISNSAVFKITGITGKYNNNTVVQSGGSTLYMQACTFQPQDTALSVTDVQIAGAGTTAKLSDCIFDAIGAVVATTTAVQVTGGASCIFSGGQIENYTNGLVIGTSGDTSSTNLNASNILISNGTNHITQAGTSTLNFVSSTANGSKITIANSTNVTAAFFDSNANNVLKIGRFNDTDTELLRASIAVSGSPRINYKSSLYSTQAIGYQNVSSNPATLFSLGNNNINITGITTDNTKASSLNLISDTGSPVGTTSALRGWDLIKTGTAAALAFSFQNNDVSDSKPVVAPYTIMQLDGFNNQVQLPNAATKILFGGDTDLYREAAGVLATDTNLIVGGLTPNTAIATNGNSQLVSSATTATELGFVHGVTSSIQTQLNNKLTKTGDTATGQILFTGGTTALPSPAVGATNIGLSSAGTDLALSTNGLSRIDITTGGAVVVNAPTTGTGLTVTANSGAPAGSFIGQSTTTAPALRLTGVPAGSTSDVFLTLDSSGNVTQSTGSFGNAIVNNGQTGPLVIGTTNNSSLSFITGSGGPNTRLSIDQNGAVTIATPTSGVGLTISGGGASITGTTNINSASATATNLGTGTGNVSLGNATGTTALAGSTIGLTGTTNITGVTNINNTGTAATNIGTGTTAGILTLGRTGGTTNINGTITIPAFTTEGVLINSNAGVVSSIDGTAGFVLTANATGTPPSFQVNPGAGGAVTFHTDGSDATASSNAITIHGGSNITTSGSGSTVTVALVNNPSVSGGLTVTAGGAAITGTTSINNSGTATTTIGNFAGPSINNIAGTTNINASNSTAATNIGNALSTTTITGPANINTSGTATTTIGNNAGPSSNNINGTTTIIGAANINTSGSATTNIGTGGTGTVNIGNSAGITITGSTTFNNNAQFPAGSAAAPSINFTGATTSGVYSPGTGQVGLAAAGTSALSATSTTITLPALAGASAGVVHTSNIGLLSNSLIVNADVDPAAAIVDTKLATISTAGKVANPATTATSVNTNNAIIARDSTGNFAASVGTFTQVVATPNGANITGATNINISGTAATNIATSSGASLALGADGNTTTILGNTNINNTGSSTTNIGTSATAGTVTIGRTGGTTNINGAINFGNNLTIPAGTAAAPSLNFTGSTTTGLSAATTNTLVLSTNGVNQLQVGPTGGIVVAAPTANITGFAITGNTIGANPAVAITQGNNALSGAALTIAGALANTADLATITQANATTQGHALTLTSIAGSSNPTASLLNLSAGTAQNSVTAAPGTFTLPAYSFIGSGSTGMYSPATNQVALTTNNAQRLLIDNNGDVTINAPTSGTALTIAGGGLTVSAGGANITGTTGITGATTITGTTNINNTGNAATNLGTGAGTVALGNSSATNTITGSTVSINGATTFANNATFAAGTAAAPSINFTGSTTTGLSAATTNTLVLSTNGVNQLQVGPTGGIVVAAPTTNVTGLAITGNTTGANPAVAITQGNNAASGSGLTVTASATATTPTVSITGVSGQNALATTVGNISFGTASSGTTLTVVGGGASITGATTINNSGSAATNIGTGTRFC